MLCQKCKNPVGDNTIVCEWCGANSASPKHENKNITAIIEELEKLQQKLRENHKITDDDFQNLKNKIIEEQNSTITQTEINIPKNKFAVDSHVVLRESGKQMRICEIDPKDGTYICYSGMCWEGNFKECDLQLFTEYAEQYKRLKK